MMKRKEIERSNFREALRQDRPRLYGGYERRKVAARYFHGSPYGTGAAAIYCYSRHWQARGVRYNEPSGRSERADIVAETAYTAYRMSCEIKDKQKAARVFYATRAGQLVSNKRWQALRCSRIPPWLRKYAGVAAEDLLEFCKKQNILNELKIATRLAQKCFWASDLKLEKEIDPETGDTQVVMALSIRSKSREEVLAAYRAFREQSVKILPWPQSSRIRLSYDLS